MEPTDVIKTVQSHLDSVLSPPVQVNADNERPVPSVLMDGWDVQDIKQHNTRYLYSEYNGSGTETARIYHVPYDLRVSFLVRHDSAFETSKLFDSLRDELLKLEVDPGLVSDEVGRVEMSSGSGVNYQYASPTEAEMTQAATFTAAQSYKKTDFETIETIDFDVEINLNT